MRILIICPTMIDSDGQLIKVKKNTLIPQSIYYLAGMVDKKHEVFCIDEAVEDIDFNVKYDLVGITATTITAKRAYAIASEFRSRGTTVVMGGIHVSMVPDEAQHYADSIVVGEAEKSWPQCIHDFENGCLNKKYVDTSRASLQKLPYPRFDLIRMNKYIKFPFKKTPFISIQTARGCPHNCDFCSVTKFWGSKIRYRPLEEVINEIKLSGADMVFFTDDNFITNPRRVRQLCELLIPLKINYFCQIDALAYKHPDLIELLSRSGCIMTFIGFESISTSTLSAFNKTFNDPNNYSQLIHLLDKNGIITFASAIFGMENDTPEVVKNTVAFFEENKTPIASFWPLCPFPGTNLYEKLVRSSQLIEREWWLNDIDIYKKFSTLQSHDYISEDLARLGMEKFYSLKSIMKRTFSFKLHRIISLVINLNARWKLKKYQVSTII
jgi:radical SAM superfamily enzyme YgiQ (UPF0313 family)